MSPSRTTTQWYPKQACQIIAENTQTWRLHAPTRKRIKASLCIFNNGFCSIHIELFLHPWIITTRLVWLTVQSMSGFGFTNEKNTTSILIILLLCFLRMLIDWLIGVGMWIEFCFLFVTGVWSDISCRNKKHWLRTIHILYRWANGWMDQKPWLLQYSMY